MAGMKASITPAKASRSKAVAKSTSVPRRTLESVRRLTGEFSSQLQALEHLPPVNIELVSPADQVPPSAAHGANADIMASAFIVLMESAKSAREDLKAIMNQVKAINRGKQALRAELGLAREKAAVDSDASFQLVATLYCAQVDAEIRSLKRKLDSMSEMGEMESLRLQMAMDRVTKLMSTLSNLLKKLSDTAGAITQNIK